MPRSKVRKEKYSTLGCEVPLTLKQQFHQAAQAEGLKESQVLRVLIRSYVNSNLGLNRLRSTSGEEVTGQ